MKGNVCYQKTDFGSETSELFNKYVLKVTQIAGIMLKSDISAEALRAALNVPSNLSELVNDEGFTTTSELNKEIQARQTTDKNLTSLSDAVTAEISSRENDDITLQNSINAEQQARENAVNALMEYITALQVLAHSHDNKGILDSITEGRVALWDKISELDNQLEFAAYKEYIQDIIFGFTDEFQRVYAAMGVNHYDGGIFGMAQNEIALDGGDFTDEVTGTVDCGGFEPIIISTETGAVIDGGTFDSVATTTIDGGTY